jgi:predicted permease
VGRSVTLNDRPTEVVGVLPPTFDFASTFTPATRVDLLTPFPISEETDQWGNTLFMIGRLRAGATAASAQADLDRINVALRAADETRWGLDARVIGLRDRIAGEHRRALVVLAAAAAAVLLIGCANLSSLLLARGRRRVKEMTVRAALGAGRRRLLRQLLVEYTVLALCGGLIGTVLALGATRLLVAANAVRIPLLNNVSVDGAALAFTLVITLFAGLLAGIMPALQVSGNREAGALNDTSRGSTESRRSARAREALVTGEVVLACVLLVASGLLLRSFVNVLDVDLGYRADGAVSWEIGTNRQFASPLERSAWYQSLVDRVRMTSGVDGAGLTDAPPLGRNRSWTTLVPGVVYEPGQAPQAFPRIVDTDYLNVMQIPLVAGRHFTRFDDMDATGVVILNETAARTLFPGQEALGRTIQFSTTGPELQVVGIAGDVRHQSLEQGAGLEVYLHLSQMTPGNATLVVRSRLATSVLVPLVRAAMREYDGTLPTTDYQTLTAVVDRAASPRRFILVLIGAFAAAALLLAALGIYAVQSYNVTQRIPEIGIRMALGESALAIRRRVVARTLVMTATGVALGALLAIMLSRLMQSLLFGVPPADALTFGAMAALLLLIGAVAGYLPARRASSTDPASTLRSA